MPTTTQPVPSTFPLTRNALTATLHDALERSPTVLAAWLMGSEANGRTDQYSDIDLICLTEDDAVEPTFNLIRETLAALSPIEIEWRVPAPTFHGHEQIFWRIRDAGPHLLVDAVVMKRSSKPESRFLETERHGTPRILFDRENLAAPIPLDRAAHHAKMQARLAQLRVRFPILQPLVTRAVARRQPCDAAYFYMQLTLLPLVETLRMLHCPDRFDFGMRYLRDDLPPDAYAAVSRLALPASLEGILACQCEAESMFNEILPKVEAALA